MREWCEQRATRVSLQAQARRRAAEKCAREEHAEALVATARARAAALTAELQQHIQDKDELVATIAAHRNRLRQHMTRSAQTFLLKVRTLTEGQHHFSWQH
jgi:uncharacterized membrane-anchored protein YhcB (DUF1043 family)